MSRKDDRALRFYNEVLDLDHLHYGMWEKTDELTLANLKAAQRRYENFLLEQIPKNVKKVLDVGCGTSAMTQRMLGLNLEVHGLSPDETQRDNFTESLSLPFYHCLFEDFDSEETFDCLVMSESAQYIPLVRLFENAKTHLVPGGYILLCDYFVLDNAEGVMAKSGHNLSQFNEEILKHGFQVIEEHDITDRVTKTLDMGLLLGEKIIKALEIISEKPRREHPWVTRILFRLFRKKWQKINADRILLDSKAFKEQKKYLFMLLKAPGNMPQTVCLPQKI